MHTHNTYTFCAFVMCLPFFGFVLFHRLQAADIQKDFNFDAKYLIWCKESIERFYGSAWSIKLARCVFGYTLTTQCIACSFMCMSM